MSLNIVTANYLLKMVIFIIEFTQEIGCFFVICFVYLWVLLFCLFGFNLFSFCPFLMQLPGLS